MPRQKENTRMYDTIENIRNSQIQHGPSSNRIYLMKVDAGDLPGLLPRLDELAEKEGYTKIFAKIPADLKQQFTLNGYEEEASIPAFYKGTGTGLFLSKYFSEDRRIEQNAKEIRDIVDLSISKSEKKKKHRSFHTYHLYKAKPADAKEMSEVYEEVFDSYPFPIYEPRYLQETMETHIQYFAVRSGVKIVSLASSEIDYEAGNVEMTDFATLPRYRGQGLGHWLLSRMETEMRSEGIATAYTIARALEPGINILFARRGYEYGGTIHNNTNIGGQIESMNVWYKSLVLDHSRDV